MTTRRTFVTATALAALLSPFRSHLLAAETPADTADFLFVQSAKGMTFDKTASKLTLTGVSPVTVFLTNRLERIAGNMKTAALIPVWSEGKEDSFTSDPSTADISLLEDGKLIHVVAVLEDPVLAGDELSYTANVLQGDMPLKGAAVSVLWSDVCRYRRLCFN